jgi:NAD(P)-dependent dehydrogenase (short-subunit alcohol dehydrogenase family)
MSGILDGKVAFVTGGSSGIGRATAARFGQEGAKVVIVDIQVDLGNQAVDEIRAAGGEALFHEADVSKWDEVQAAVEATVRAYGRLDCAFNNAGVEGPVLTPTADFGLDDWTRILATDLTGVFFCMKAELKVMQAQKSGAIVNMSSIAGVIGDTMIGAAYHASKFGVIGLTKTAALEYVGYGIRINAVSPGFIDTPMVRATYTDPRVVALKLDLKAALESFEPMKRLGRPEEVAAVVTWLCSDASSFVTGFNHAVDGGLLAK